MVPIESQATLGPATEHRPMQFAHFQFDPDTDRLGEGPLSEVYRAKDLTLGRTVALKILRSHAEIDPQADERFLREAVHTSNLEHPNIATIYEYGQDAGTSYIAMEFLQGRTLDKVIKDRLLGFEECVRIGLQVTKALRFVHEKRIIHRDLKPGNILLQDDGTVKLLDFGIARARDESAITQHGMLVGTVLYMSPEQVRGEDLGFRSDVFSLGAVLYHVMTGNLPFPGTSFPEVCMAILDGKFRPPSQIRSGFPKQLDQLIQQCLQVDADKRFADAAQVHDALSLISNELSGTGTHVAATVRGTIVVTPLGCGGSDLEACRVMAGGVRRDIVSDLKRNKGVEVIVSKDGSLPTDRKFDCVLRGDLAVEGHTGTLDLRLEWYSSNSKKAEPVAVYENRCKHSDEDEWTLQADLVRSAVRNIRRRMIEASVRPAEETRRKVEEALALAEHAIEVMHRGTTKHLLAAISTFRRAQDLDRYCALASAGLAEAMVRKYLYWDGDHSFLEESRDFAGRALALDPNCAQAHTSLGFSYHVSGHSADAMREYRLAIQKSKDEWLAHRLLGAMLGRDGNFTEASALLRRAMALEPRHIAIYDHFYMVLQRLDRYEEALDVADKGIAMGNKRLAKIADDQSARLHLAMLYARIGQQDEARQQVAEAKRRSPKDGYTAFYSAEVYALMGALDEAMASLTLAADRGYFVKSELSRNRDFDVLRGLESFQELST